MAQVCAALSHDWEHIDEIRQAIADEGTLVEKVRLQTPSRLAKKMGRAEQNGHSAPLCSHPKTSRVVQ